MTQSLSIVVPVYNEEETLAYSHAELAKLLDHPGLDELDEIELIYVNDGSQDGSHLILDRLATTASLLPRLRIVHLEFSRNFGHSAAVLAGIEAAQGDYIAIIDADLQDPPDLIPAMLQPILKGEVDVVYGRRIRRSGETILKRVSAWAFYRVLRALTRVDIPSDTGDFRVITREVRDAVVSCREREPFLRGVIAWVGFRQLGFAYNRKNRKFGNTKYPLSKMIRFALQAVLSFSSAPLLISIWLGSAGILGCFGISTWAVIQHLHGHTVSGWTSLLIGFMLGQSMTIFLVGILGAYVGRMFSELQGRPRYIARRSKSQVNANSERRQAA